MDESWLTINHINSQENEAELITLKRFGKNRDGFCDYALTGIELLIQGMYLRDIDELNENQDYKNFNCAIRFMAYLQIQRVSYSFKATYNLLLQGYYTESAILLRTIIETFVRIRYIYNTGEIENIKKALESWKKPRKKGFNVQYREMFKAISSELYEMYQFLCDISHGGIGSHVLRTDPNPETFKIDTGIVYRKKSAEVILNQYTAYLLAHIEMMSKLFPEILDKMPSSYSDKYHKELHLLWTYMEQVSKDKSSKFWYNSIKDLVNF